RRPGSVCCTWCSVCCCWRTSRMRPAACPLSTPSRGPRSAIGTTVHHDRWTVVPIAKSVFEVRVRARLLLLALLLALLLRHARLPPSFDGGNDSDGVHTVKVDSAARRS